MIRVINSVTVYVHNQNEAIRFYKDVLGFEMRRWEALGPAGSWIEMAPTGSQTTIVLYPATMMPDHQSRRAFVIFGSDDLDASFQALTARGVTFSQEPSDLGWGKFAMFQDPWGNEYGLMQVTRAAAPMPDARGRMPSGPPPPPPPAPGRR